MSFGNKDNGREYTNRNNSNPNKMQSSNSRNLNSSQQYSNSNNGENYSYEMKRGSNSPKQSGEIHNNNQQNSNIKEHYNSRGRHYPSKYNPDRPNYYNQQSNSPDVIIPDIDQLKDFIRDQSAIFQNELSKYEMRKSYSPPPRSNFHQDQSQQKSQQRSSYIGQNKTVCGMSTSNSLGTIACSNSNFSAVTSSKLDKQSNSYPSKYSYNKTVQSTGKSNSETYSKAPVNKNRVSSPNSMVEKPSGNKSQFITPSNIGGPRQDSKSDINKPNKYASYAFSSGINSANSQQNSNNPVTAISLAHKINQPSRSNMSSIGSNGKNVGSNSFDAHKSSTRVNGETEQIRPHKVEVRIADTPRSVLNSANTTDSLDVDFCTSDSPTSPSSPRSSQTDDNRGGPGLRPTKKAT